MNPTLSLLPPSSRRLSARVCGLALLAGLHSLTAFAAAADYPDLPPLAQVDRALHQHVTVSSAELGVKIEQINQRKLESGNYEFNLRAGAAQRRITLPSNSLNEWDVALERPFRLPAKVGIDRELGLAGVQHAGEILGDAHHEAGRLLLKLWFNWQREDALSTQWQQQVELLKQQAAMTEKRVKAGDAPRMELSQAHAATSQAMVAWQQHVARAQLANDELRRQFSEITPAQNALSEPQKIGQPFAYWRDQMLAHNHELGIAQAEQRIQQKNAERSQADILPDPTLGLRFSNEMGGNEKVTGVYLAIPLSFGLRHAQAEQLARQSEIAHLREAAIEKRLEIDCKTVHAQAVSQYQIWLQAHETAENVRQNTALVAKAYSLGESSLSETLAARRIAMEATLAETLSRLDANESRYRLLLDAHQLWQLDEHDEADH